MVFGFRLLVPSSKSVVSCNQMKKRGVIACYYNDVRTKKNSWKGIKIMISLTTTIKLEGNFLNILLRNSCHHLL